MPGNIIFTWRSQSEIWITLPYTTYVRNDYPRISESYQFICQEGSFSENLNHNTIFVRNDHPHIEQSFSTLFTFKSRNLTSWTNQSKILLYPIYNYLYWPSCHGGILQKSQSDCALWKRIEHAWHEESPKKLREPTYFLDFQHMCRYYPHLKGTHCALLRALIVYIIRSFHDNGNKKECSSLL